MGLTIEMTISFQLKLASTAFVKFSARPWAGTFYADITVHLPPDDHNNTVGLCGNNDDDRGNDMTDKTGVVHSGCGTCTAFTESWK